VLSQILVLAPQDTYNQQPWSTSSIHVKPHCLPDCPTNQKIVPASLPTLVFTGGMPFCHLNAKTMEWPEAFRVSRFFSKFVIKKKFHCKTPYSHLPYWNKEQFDLSGTSLLRLSWKKKQTVKQVLFVLLQNTRSRRQTNLLTGFIANSKYKIQALFKDFQGPKLHFSSTKIIEKAIF